MEQHSDSTVNMVSSPTQNPSNTGVAVAPDSKDVMSEQCPDSASNKPVTLHQLPIPPASEPMQYRAIGLIKGTYIPSEEQFTRGMLTTENNQTVDAVLLGRVMSLVKKHVDLTIPHLWVVYPRTRPKAEHLHAQIVGIWEPDNLNRDPEDELASGEFDASDDEAVVAPDDGAVTEPEVAIASDDTEPNNTVEDTEAGAASEGTQDASEETVETATPEAEAPSEVEAPSKAETPSKAEVENEPSETDQAVAETSETGEEDANASLLMKPARPTPSVPEKPATTPEPSALEVLSEEPSDNVPDMTDGYFSIRGEVIQCSPEDEEITVRIRQAKRKSAKASEKDKKSSDESKEFKLQLKGRLEGRAVGYFWDFHAQRDGNDLVVTDSTMIKIVPPRKNSRKKGGRGGPGRGGPRRRDGGGSRPMRSGDRPTPAAPSRRGPTSKPVLKKSGAKDSGGADAEA